MRDHIAHRVRGCFRKGPSLRPFFEMLATMGEEGISLGIGEPDFATPDHIVAAGVRALEAGRTCYTSNYGTLELRKALAEHLARLYDVSYDPDREIIITVGVSEALAIALLAIPNSCRVPLKPSASNIASFTNPTSPFPVLSLVT